MDSLRQWLSAGRSPRLDALASLLLVVTVFSGKLGIGRLLTDIDPSPLTELRFWSMLGTLALLWRARATIAWVRTLEPAPLALAALCLLLIVRGLFGHGPGFAEKSLDMVFLLAQCAVVLVSSRRQLVLMAVWAILFALLLFMLAALGLGNRELNGPGWAPMGGPTTFYRIEFLGACLCWGFYRVLGVRYWWLPLAAAVLLFGTLASLSKIALPAAMLVFAVMALHHLRRKEWLQAVLLVLASAAPVAVWQGTLVDAMQVRLGRALVTATPGNPRTGTDFEINTRYCVGRAPDEKAVGENPANCVNGYFVDRSSRLVFAAHALAGIAAKPFWGHGLSTFELHMPNPISGVAEVYRYPHNVVLEVAFESGLAGGGLLILALAMLFWTAARSAQHEPAGMYLLGAMGFILLSALVSGDFYDSRLLWLLGFALLALTSRRAPGQ